jgi:tight adherence protein C
MVGEAAASALLVFALVAIGAAALYELIFARRRSSDERLLEPGIDAGGGTSLLRNSPPAGLPGLMVERIARQVREGAGLRPNQRRLTAALSHAGYVGIDKLVIFRIIQVGVAGVFGLAGAWIAWGNGSLGTEFGLVLAILGYILPNSVLRRLGRARQIKIARELPATLDLMVVCLEAGLGLAESVKLVARESQRRGGVLGAELAQAAAEMSTGASLPDSLHSLAERVGSDELKSLAALIIQSDQMGTRLGPALRASGEQFAAKRRARAEERAQRSAVHMLIPLVILILPAMLIIVLGPAFIQVLAVLQN